jgi:hypothetical protein
MLVVTLGCASAARSPEPADSSRGKFVADSIEAAKCTSTLASARSGHSTTDGGAFVRVRATFHDTVTVSGATLTSKKPRLSVQSGGDGIIRADLPVDSIPRSHSLAIAVRLVGFKWARGTIEVAPGDTVDVDVRFCAQPLYLQQAVRTRSER